MPTGHSRIDESVAYIYGLGKSHLANHLDTVVRSGSMRSIDSSLSLGSRPDNKSSPQFAANSSRRKALRALLLCQRVYFSDLWWRSGLIGQGMVANSVLPADWKAQSLQYWGNKTEAEIVEGIMVFATTTADPSKLVTASASAPNGGAAQPDLTLTRATDPFPGLISCYGSVMTWLFRSGIVSYRWYARHNGANNEATLRAAFGSHPVTLIGPNQAFTANDVFPNVPAGHIVHLYAAEHGGHRWNGHWLVSIGGGLARGCNNDTTDGTPNYYTASCSLKNQFLNGYRDEIDGHPGEYWKGIAEVYNPSEIPDRL